MILELLQNADDAEAERIVFDITDEGLHLFNSGEFSYCGKLASSNCLFEKESCDFHRIKEVASGGKLKNQNNIGRFGIGFVSTYQITDSPEIKSSGIKLKLIPEKGQSTVDVIPKESGSSFFLPWAFDSMSHARQALNLSAIDNKDIQEITNSFLSVVRHSLLFLRYVNNVLVQRNGEILLECTIDRSSNNEVMVEFKPDNQVEIWHILRADAAYKVNSLFETYPQLEKLQRNTGISVAIRTEPDSLEKGLLYAYLPTEQKTQLPLHINADFFPESDRKSIIFSGKHERAWNETLIDVAAQKIAENPIVLLDVMGLRAFWILLEEAHALYSSSDTPSPSFKKIWEYLKKSCSVAEIATDQKNQSQKPSGLWFISGFKPNKQQQDVLHKIGIHLTSDDLQDFTVIYKELGSRRLDFSNFVDYLSHFFLHHHSEKIVSEQEIGSFYKPLWSIVEELIPDNTSNSHQINTDLSKFINIDLFLTINRSPTSLSKAYKSTNDLYSYVQRHLPSIPIIHFDISSYQKISKITKIFDLSTLVENLKNFNSDDESLKSLYKMLTLLSANSKSCEELKNLTIWKTGSKFLAAKDVLMPGDFTDPTGQANLLDMTVISDEVKKFLSEKLDMKKQNIQEFVATVLPIFFNNQEKIDISKYKLLISELIKNQHKLIDDDATKKILRENLLIPTQSGHWRIVQAVYRKTDDLVKILGENNSLWLDEQKIPSEETVKNFINSLGILTTPKIDDLINRILQIAKESQPTKQSIDTCAIAFYFLCDLFKKKQIDLDKVDRLKNQKCFPAKNDNDNWYTPSELHAPYRSEGFDSQAKIIAFSDTSKLDKEILSTIGVNTEPSTEIVINHLLYCIESKEKPHKTTYTILNERSGKDSDKIKQRLSNKSCIHIDGWNRFAFPYEIYWDTVELGKYAITIPDSSHEYKNLFDSLGIKKHPDVNDYICILNKLVIAHYNNADSIGNDLAVYNKCISEINAYFTSNGLSTDQIHLLAKNPIIINLHKEFVYPADALLLDSPWHVSSFFDKELDQALCDSNYDVWSLFEKTGANRTSQSVSIELDYADGERKSEDEFTSWWKDYESIILRLTNEYNVGVRKKLLDSINSLAVYSYNMIKIIAEVTMTNGSIKSEPKPVNAFFDKDKNELLIVNKTNSDWLDIFNSFFYQMLPYKTAEEVSKLSMLLDSVRGKDIQQAHQYLDKAGIASIRSHEAIEGVESEKVEVFSDNESNLDEINPSSSNKETSIESQPVKEVESTEPPKNPNTQKNMSLSDFKNLMQKQKEEEKNVNQESTIEKNSMSSASDHLDLKTSNSSNTFSDHNWHDWNTDNPDRNRGASSSSSSDHNWHEWNANNPNRNRGSSSTSSARNSATKQRNQQLRSYVLPAKEADAMKEGSEEKRKHNLAVEALSREVVCRYEKKKGRIPTEMPQTHPGYDIRSINALTGEKRLIEVKGISGQWNNTGVGLSRLQFSNAQDYGDTYWLYVVDHIENPNNSNIYPICSPAMKVNVFMFDEGWKDVAFTENDDSILAFIPTAKVCHEQWGAGIIKKAIIRGNDRSLLIEFEQHGERTLSFSLNKAKMTVLLD
jgi:hypothetical protein